MEPSGKRVVVEWLAREPPQTLYLRAGRRIGMALVDQISARVHELRLLDDQLGGVDTMPLVSAELEQTQRLAREASYTEHVSTRLLGTLAELSQIAGWTASDAGQHEVAERRYLQGIRAARQAEATAIGADLLSCLSYQVANIGRPSDAVSLACAAVDGADGVTGRARALLLDRLAWAYARAGDITGCDRMLAHAEDVLREAGDNEPPWAYWVNSVETSIMAGRCYVELHRPLRAVPVLSVAIESYPPELSRETALYRTWLAEAYLQANEHDAARATLETATLLADGIHSERLRARIRGVAARIPA